MRYPKLNQLPTSLTVTDKFRGYNHNLKIADGEFFDCLNMVTDYYPMAASAKKYSDLYSFSSVIKGAIQKDGRIYSVVNGVLLRDSSDTGLQGLSDSYKQMVSMGAYICIFPDGAYYNTQNIADYGFMGETWEFSTADDPRSFTVETCNESGTAYTNITESYDAPTNPTDGKLWCEMPGRTLKKWIAAESRWETITPVYNKIAFSNDETLELMRRFKTGESVFLIGIPFDWLLEVNILNISSEIRSEILYSYLVVKGKAMAAATYSSISLYIERRIPAMDYVCECQNRLWGCRYGLDNQHLNHVNEIYACELGNFRNWYKYEGLSTDSWSASVGSDGAWTGAVNFEGKPTFFKEKKVHQVTVSAQGAHRISEFSCDGVQEGSSESLCIVDNVLYYKAPSKFVAFQGGLTQDISYQLSDERYYNCAAGTENGKIYFSVDCDAGSDTPYKIFIYDTAKKLWSRIQNVGYHVTNIVSVLGVNDSDFLFAVAANQIRELTGNRSAVTSYADKWWFETGMIGYEQTDHKYISRFTFRLKMEQGAALDLYIEYDSSGTWEHAGHVNITGTNSFTIPVRPRRCDHMRIRVEGNGEAKIYSIARHLAKGSDHR